MDCALRLVVVALIVAGLEAAPAAAQTGPTPVAIQPAPSIPTQPPATDQFSADEIVDAGQHFFSSISRGLASVIEKAVSRWGLPNGYILGEEAGGAFWGAVMDVVVWLRGLGLGKSLLFVRQPARVLSI